MKNKLLIAFFLIFAAVRAQAHFQLIYTPEVHLDAERVIPVALIFAHPMENGFVMDMEKPEQFYYLFKNKKEDLLPTLKPITFSGAENQAAAFTTEVNIRRNGDYIFVLKPAPYYEKSEDIYIQQITKTYVNKGNFPDNWSKEIGLPTEIVPLNKPTNIIAGSTFSGRVLSAGKPAVGVEIEIEYLAAEPDLNKNAPVSHKKLTAAGGSIVAITDDNGVFTFGIPKAGFWGFAALGSGAEKEYKGKPLSQDAVIWIRAEELATESL